MKLFPNMDCYLDMDGVQLDMHTPCLKAYDKTILLQGDQWPMTTNQLNEAVGVAKEEFWNKIDATESWWQSLYHYPWAMELVEFLQDNFRTLRILTHPQDTKGSYAGKLGWIHRMYANHPPIIFCEEKHLLARHDRFLIDDTPSIVQEWRGKGGRGLVFPRPWNTRSKARELPMSYVAGHLFTLSKDLDTKEPWEIFPVESLEDKQSMAASENVKCIPCQGTGKILDDPCKNCNGKGVIIHLNHPIPIPCVHCGKPTEMGKASCEQCLKHGGMLNRVQLNPTQETTVP